MVCHSGTDIALLGIDVTNYLLGDTPMTRTKSTFLALLAVLLSPMAAQADVIDFSGEADGAYAIFDGAPDTYDISGFTFDGHFLYTTAGSGCGEGGCNTIDGESGQIADFFGAGTPVMTLAESGGNAFSLVSLDAAIAYLNISSLYNADSLTVVGTLFGGGTVSQTMGLGLGAGTMSFDSSWGNLLSIEFAAGGSGNGSNAFVTDNIVLGAATVPEPGTLALLGIGLLGMGAARRRKKA